MASSFSPPIRLSAHSTVTFGLCNTHTIMITHIIHKGTTTLNVIIIVERYNEYRIKVVELSSSLSLTGLTSFYLVLSLIHSTNASSPFSINHKEFRTNATLPKTQAIREPRPVGHATQHKTQSHSSPKTKRPHTWKKVFKQGDIPWFGWANGCPRPSIFPRSQTLDGDDTVRGACVQRARPLALVEVAVGGVQVMHVPCSGI